MVLPVTNPTKSFWVHQSSKGYVSDNIDSQQIEAAESDLRDFRSSDDLPQEAEIVVVGSGYAGASTAYWVHKVCGELLL